MSYIKTPWYKKDQLDELYAQLQLGCRLEFKRTGYFHWAIYVGLKEDNDDAENQEGKVNGNTEKKEEGNGDETDKSKDRMIIHRCIPPNVQRNELMSSFPIISYGKIQLGQLIMTPIEEAVGDYEVRINNEMDKNHCPKHPLEIVAIAKKLMKLERVKQKSYNLLIRNCEHFANQCRYGINKCEQIKEFATKAVISTAVGGASVGARVGIGILAASAVVPAIAAPAVLIGGSVLTTIPWIVHGIQYLVKIHEKKKNG